MFSLGFTALLEIVVLGKGLQLWTARVEQQRVASFVRNGAEGWVACRYCSKLCLVYVEAAKSFTRGFPRAPLDTSGKGKKGPKAGPGGQYEIPTELTAYTEQVSSAVISELRLPIALRAKFPAAGCS